MIVKIFKQLGEFLFELLRLVLFMIATLFILTFNIINILNSLVPQTTSKKLIITILNSDLNRIIIGLLGLLGALFAITIKRKELKPFSPLSLKKDEMVIIGLSSYFLAYFIKENLIAPNFIKKVFVVILTVIFFLFLPQLLNYFLKFNPNYLNRLLRSINNELNTITLYPFSWRNFLLNTRKLIHKLLPYILLLMTFLIIMFVLVITISLQIKKYLAYQSDLRRRVVITKIKPTITTIGEKVILEGYNFGFKENALFQIKSNFGLITDIKDWNNNQVEFIVPLDFKEGQIKLWLERTKESSSQSAKLKSNRVDLEILSRWEYYPEAEEFQYPPSVFRWFKVVQKKIIRYFRLRN